MSVSVHPHSQNKYFLSLSMTFLQHLEKKCKMKQILFAPNKQEVPPANKQSSSINVKAQDIESLKNAQKMVQKAAVTMDISDILSYITSGETPTENKLAVFRELEQKCQENRGLYNKIIFSGVLFQYAEKLLCIYTRSVQYFLSYTATNCDLRLLTALLQFLMSMKDLTIETITKLFINQSECLMYIMHATFKCSHHLTSTLNKFQKFTAKKDFAASSYAMTRSKVHEHFQSCFGIKVSSLNLNLEGYGVLYDITENGKSIRAQQKVDDVHLSEKDGEPCKGVWNDVTIEYTLPPNYGFIYTDSSYKESLFQMSPLLQAEIDTEGKRNCLVLGAVFALYSADVTFERVPSQSVECIRGQLLAEVSDTAIIWAMDFGQVGFISARKIYLISSQELIDIPPLAKLCVMEALPASEDETNLKTESTAGMVQEAEEEFLCAALKLLRFVFESNSCTGKAMLVYEGEETFFQLLKYDKAEIRIAFLDVLACLAKDYRDVNLLMEEVSFDKAVLGKLEYYAYVYTADLYKCKTTMENDIKYMIDILQAIIERKQQIGTSTETERFITVISKFIDTTYPWKKSINSIVSSLENEEALERMSGYSYRRKNNGWKREGQWNGDNASWRRRFNRDSMEGQRRFYRDSTEGQRTWNRNYTGEQRRGYREHSEGRDQSRGVPIWQQRTGQENRRKLAENRDEHLRNLNAFKTKENELPEEKQATGLYKMEQNSNLTLSTEKMENKAIPQDHNESNDCSEQQTDLQIHNDKEIEQHKFDRKIHQEVAEARMGNSLTPRCLNTYVREGHNESYSNGKPHYMRYTEIVDNTDEILVLSAEKKEDIVDLTTKSEFNYVIKGSTVSVQPDEKHAFITSRNLKELKEVELAKVMCGLLNSTTVGYVYFGITVKSVIVGITLSRGDKDTFRCAIDRILRRCIVPEVRPSFYNVLFTPVIYKENVRCPDLYIIEVQICPVMHTVYTVYHGRSCYIREGTETIEYVIMQKIQDTMDAQEKEVEKYLEGLNISSNMSMAELAAFVEKHISQDQSQA